MSAYKEYLRVLRLHIRMQLSLSKARKRSGKETAKMLGFTLLILYAVGAVILMYALILYPFLHSAAQAGLQMPVMGMIVLLCMVIVMVFGTMTLISLVFGAKDAEVFAALPLREQSVFAAKFTMAYGIELGMSAVFLWPAAIIYGMVSELPAPAFMLLVLRTLPIWLLLPAVPMAFAAVLSMLFTRLTALARHRDKLMLFFGIGLVLVLAVGQGLLAGQLAPALEDPEKVMALLTDNSAFLDAVTRSFPPAQWASQSLVGDHFASAGFGFLGLIAAAAIGAAVCLLLSRRLYYKGVLAQLEAPKSKKKAFSQAAVKTGGALGAYVSKELRIILRTPVYAMNILTGLFILPLMVVVGLAGSSGLSTGASTIQDFLDGLFGASSGDMYFLLAAGIVLITALMGSTGVSTSLSREGSTLWISQTVPVPARTQVAARILGGFVLTVIGAVLSLLALIFFIGLTAAQAIFGLVAGLCAAFPVLAAALIPDALRPKRKWNSEAEAMKQNVNSILALLLDVGIAAAVIFAAYGLQMLIPAWAAGCVIAVACLAVGYALYLYAVRIADKMMQTVDG